MQDYKIITFDNTKGQNDLVIALLNDLQFDSYEESSENSLKQSFTMVPIQYKYSSSCLHLSNFSFFSSMILSNRLSSPYSPSKRKMSMILTLIAKSVLQANSVIISPERELRLKLSASR